ncbi:hypothetical protein KKB55_00455, partial [Myxococcota bacterium]|nr:hypothetical protein [Myxococcota bacterium]
MLFSALFITILAAPTLEIPCDEPLGALIERLPGPATLQLAAGCRYEAPLTISGDRVVALRGRVGTTLGGGLRLQGARAITLSHLRLEGQVSLVAHRVDALTLDGVVLSGVDGVHITDSGAILLRRARIESAQSGIWLERVVSFTFVQSEVTGARVALVSHQAQRLAIIDSTLRADPRSEAEAAVVVEGGAARLLRNRLESL